MLGAGVARNSVLLCCYVLFSLLLCTSMTCADARLLFSHALVLTPTACLHRPHPHRSSSSPLAPSFWAPTWQSRCLVWMWRASQAAAATAAAVVAAAQGAVAAPHAQVSGTAVLVG